MTSEGRVPSLDDAVVAEHPDGHRIVGTVVGVGTRGVILHSAPLHAGFLSYDDGWTVTVTAPARVSSATDGAT